jgi:hypothetical protein
MALAVIVFKRGTGHEVAKKIQRATGAAGIKPLRRPGKKPQEVRLGQAMKVDYEIKLGAPDIFD